ncbi:Zinc knuckle family protein [Theileria parva strain Muguga]|uniref:Zinc knuckle family protein n=1 Tax=Theileria parva strain Muguga TaxID=333668 RepID=UPI001C61EB15|nr:Zinc knuckle family protein [Theileria parva strain Muguga]EAN33806.2 Zinc knuckle family protein [Theileria parva strain Muguga]
MSSRYKRNYENCWGPEKIKNVLEERVAELKSDKPKSKSRIKLLRAKISKLNKALEGKTTAGGQISPKQQNIAKNKNLTKSSKLTKIKKLRRKRIRKICFKCRKRGHLLEDCKENDTKPICFKCGSDNHTLKNCTLPNQELPYASCFVCGERGHLSSQCPENPKGIFPKGSGCHFCGSVRHKKANCPEYTKSHQSSNN